LKLRELQQFSVWKSRKIFTAAWQLFTQWKCYVQGERLGKQRASRRGAEKRAEVTFYKRGEVKGVGGCCWELKVKEEERERGRSCYICIVETAVSEETKLLRRTTRI
jgi:hypothetical protein